MGISRDVLFSTLVSTFVSLFVLIIGYVGNRLYEKYKRNKELEGQKEYFIALVRILNPAIERQSNEFLRFSHFLKRPSQEAFHFNRITSFNLSYLKEVSHFDLYNIFLKRHNNREIETRTPSFVKLQNNIRLLDQLSNSYEGIYLKCIEEMRENQNKWNENLFAIRHLFDKELSCFFNVKTEKKDAPFMSEVINLHHEFKKYNGISERNIVFAHYILPFIEICKKHAGDNLSPEFLSYLLKCTENEKHLKLIQYSFRRQFILLAKRSLTAKFEINAALGHLT